MVGIYDLKVFGELGEKRRISLLNGQIDYILIKVDRGSTVVHRPFLLLIHTLTPHPLLARLPRNPSRRPQWEEAQAFQSVIHIMKNRRGYG